MNIGIAIAKRGLALPGTRPGSAAATLHHHTPASALTAHS